MAAQLQPPATSTASCIAHTGPLLSCHLTPSIARHPQHHDATTLSYVGMFQLPMTNCQPTIATLTFLW